MVGANVDLSQITPDEWESLLNGEKYPCQVNHCSFIWGLAIPQLSFSQLMLGAGDARDVTLNVNLAGIRLLDPKTEVFLFFFSTFFLCLCGWFSMGGIPLLLSK